METAGSLPRHLQVRAKARSCRGRENPFRIMRVRDGDARDTLWTGKDGDDSTEEHQGCCRLPGRHRAEAPRLAFCLIFPRLAYLLRNSNEEMGMLLARHSTVVFPARLAANQSQENRAPCVAGAPVRGQCGGGWGAMMRAVQNLAGRRRRAAGPAVGRTDAI